MASFAAQRCIAAAAAVISFIRAEPLTAGASDSAMEARLYISAAPDIEQQWSEGRRLELEGRDLERDEPQLAVVRYLGAARVYENIALERPDLARAHWRSARAYWTAGDTLPLDSKTERLGHFERAEGHASRGIEVDPECAECMLWKFASMGRLRTTRGVFTGVRQLPDMAMLLDRGIALNPTYSDGTDNSTLGNLHYSSAIFYRVFPDWFWVGWLIGVRGDKERCRSIPRDSTTRSSWAASSSAWETLETTPDFSRKARRFFALPACGNPNHRTIYASSPPRRSCSSSRAKPAATRVIPGSKSIETRREAPPRARSSSASRLKASVHDGGGGKIGQDSVHGS
jgi:hypothetical protein